MVVSVLHRDRAWRDGYDKYRGEFAKLIWQLASPRWHFADATSERSAKAFDNPDNIAIVIDNYRWRLCLAQGEAKCDNDEKRPAQSPVISAPTVAMEGNPNGAPHPEPASYAKSSRAAIRTELSGAASDTIFRRKRRRHLPRQSSTSQT